MGQQDARAARHISGSKGSQGAAVRTEQDGWRRPWIPWLVGLGLIILGAAVGWGSSYLALKPILGQRPGAAPVITKPVAAGDNARVEEARAPSQSAAPGGQLTVTWQVRNTGGLSWAADSYRFTPQTEQTPVIPLPRTVRPGQTVTIQAVLTVPELTDAWQPAWQLTGPKGPVPGGTLTTTIAIQPEVQENPADSGNR